MPAAKSTCLLEGDLAGRLLAGFRAMADLLEDAIRQGEMKPVEWDDVDQTRLVAIGMQDEIADLLDTIARR